MRLRKTGRWPDFPWTARCVSGRFRNAGDPWTPGIADVLGWKLGLVRARAPRPVPTNFAAAVVAPDLALIHRRESEPTAATWIGHATFLVQAGGLNVLTDPMFSEYCSPWPIPRLRRAAPPGLALGELPRIDLVLLSHAHYDHLDRASLRRLGPEIPIACPLGMGPLLRGWGFRNAVELGWGETGELGSARLCCLPGQHGAARGLLDRDATLWCGWMLEVGGRRIYFAGDTGYAPYFPELFARFAPVDLALLEQELIEFREERPDAAVVVRADRSLPYQQVMDVYDIIQRAKIERMSLGNTTP